MAYTPQQIMDFNPDSMGVEGTTWWKPDGSDHFTVRDLIMSPEGMTVRTTDGRTLDGRVMETYVQSEVPIAIPKHAPQQRINLTGIDDSTPVEQAGVKPLGSLKHSHPDVKFQPDNRPRSVPKTNDPLEQPLSQLQSTIDDTPAPVEEPQVPAAPNIDPVDLAMIERVLGKASFDCIHVDVQDDGTLANGISTLATVLNVSPANIRNWLNWKISQQVQVIADAATSQLMDTVAIPE